MVWSISDGLVSREPAGGFLKGVRFRELPAIQELAANSLAQTLEF